MIRHLSALVIATIPALGLSAQQSQEELQKLYDQKLAKPFVEKGSWLLDFDAAKAQAKRDDKLIFAYFTTSYFR